MTGFGLGRASVGNEEISVELRSVNHKFCEVKCRLPRELSTLEAAAVRQVKDRLSRGAIDLIAKRSSSTVTGAVPTIDPVLAREYRRAFKELAEATGLPDAVTVGQIAAYPGVIRLEESQVNVEDAGKALEQATAAAVTALIAMRDVEGKTLVEDLRARLSLVSQWSKEVATLLPPSVESYRAKLFERVTELARGGAVDPSRLAQEVAIFAERTDVAEELTRLQSHLNQFETLLRSTEPSGRKLDFLVQEMHREVNTTGSKSQHADISTRVVAMKAELERVREQVQNIE
jgi:uncharacterized protein (TIGR00255 family)